MSRDGGQHPSGPAATADRPDESASRAANDLLGAFQVAWRTSVAAVEELAPQLAALAARPDLGPSERFVAELVQALIDVRLRRPDAPDVVAGLLAGFPQSPLAADPALTQLAAMGAVVLVEPELVRPLARASLSRTDLDDVTRGRLLHVVSLSDAWSGDLVRGHLGLREARELARRAELLPIEAEVTCLLAKVEALRGEIDAAKAHLDEGRELGARAGSEWIAGGHLECALSLHQAAGDEDAYAALLALAVRTGTGVDSGLLWEYRYEQATALAQAGDSRGARRLLAETPPAPPELAGATVLPAWRDWLLDPDDDSRAAALERAADRLTRPVEQLLKARVAWLLGCRYAARGRRVDAIRLLESAAQRYAAIGALGLLVRVRDELRRLTPDAARDDAQRHTPADLAQLTEAERRVAIAVSAGLTNREVAEALFLSVRTVESHLAAVFRKLGVRNRTELAIRR